MSFKIISFLLGGLIFFFLTSLPFLFYTWIFNSNSETKLRNYIIFNIFLLSLALILYIFLLIFGRDLKIITPNVSFANEPEVNVLENIEPQIDEPENDELETCESEEEDTVLDPEPVIRFCDENRKNKKIPNKPSTLNGHSSKTLDSIIEKYFLEDFTDDE